ncbi:MAG: hypothetical protein COY81_03020 [Candidatus Pacebacteria bacterium CG_4_10_14_0_8_um_filter_43_12]|nr:MAG: hypothetical protein COY81_03020 [Candidatus Pacebacteria bacterium CG_4_10_14_0_8_um_filter_43_12]
MSKEIPSPGEKHYTATVFLVTEEQPQKVLLVHHRKMDKWMPPGGHQENNENPYEAAIRETQEETSIDIAEYIPKPKQIDQRAISLPLPRYILEERIDARGEQPEHYHLDLIYVVSVPYQEVKHQEAESHSIGWFDEKEVAELPIFENVAILINAIFNSLEV